MGKSVDSLFFIIGYYPLDCIFMGSSYVVGGSEAIRGSDKVDTKNAIKTIEAIRKNFASSEFKVWISVKKTLFLSNVDINEIKGDNCKGNHQ